jgi:hypothetical protein
MLRFEDLSGRRRERELGTRRGEPEMGGGKLRLTLRMVLTWKKAQ